MQDECVTTEKRLRYWIDACKKAGTFGFDTETTGLRVVQGDDALVGICLATSPDAGCYVPIGHTTGETQLDFDLVVDAVAPLLEDKKLKKVAHNFGFDFNVMAMLGVETRNYDDTQLMSYALDGQLHRARGHNFDSLVKFHFGHDSIRFEDVVIPDLGISHFGQVRLAHATAYASEDARWTLKLYWHLKKMLEGEGLDVVYEGIDHPLARVTADMTRRGVLIDLKKCAKLDAEWSDNLDRLQAKINKEAGREINLGSPKQKAAYLYDELKLPIPDVNEGSRSTDREALEELKGEHPIIDTMLEYAKFSKLVGDVTSKWPTLADKKGRLHGSFMLTSTNTRRLSSTDPNEQNVPTRSAEGKECRSLVIAPKGRKLVVNDASQIEYRLLAHVTKCRPMIDMFHAGYDFHAATAADIFGGEWKDYLNKSDSVRTGQRASMKNTNFGIIYGVGARKLARMCGIPEKEAYRILDEYKGRFPEVFEWKAEVAAFAEANGYIETLFGGRIHVPMAQWSDKGMKAYGIRQAINGVIQGTAADIIRIAMSDVHAKLKSFRSAWLLMQVHDELVVECEERDAEEVCALVKQSIEKCTAPLIRWRIPIVSNGAVVQNWSEAK